MPLFGPPLDRPIQLPELLHRGLEATPDAPALVSAETRWSWRELDQASKRLAGNLLSLGLRPGDRVASVMPNRTALLVHYLACMRAGLVATPLNYRYMPPEIDHALEAAGASLLLAHAERDGDIAASRLAGRLPLGVIRYGPAMVARRASRTSPAKPRRRWRSRPRTSMRRRPFSSPRAAPVRPKG